MTRERGSGGDARGRAHRRRRATWWRAYLACLLAVVALSCARGADPTAVGVFADTDAGVVALRAYGEQVDSTRFRFADLASVPRAARVTRFFVNLPGVDVATAALSWIPALRGEAGDSLVATFFWYQDRTVTVTLDLTMQRTTDSTYVLSSETLKDWTDGVWLLRIRAPTGPSERAYAIRLGE